MRVTLEPHNPEWIIRFEQVHQSISKILHRTPPVSIEHVGSTSIPGLLAKPVLDIDIVVRSNTLTETRAALVSAGYIDLGELGIPDRMAFRQPGYANNSSDGSDSTGGMRCNTYVILDGSLSLKNHVDLKRLLLSNRLLREEYSEVKGRLAEQDLEDVNAYCRGKTGIMLKILREAGWSEKELEEVAKANA